MFVPQATESMDSGPGNGVSMALDGLLASRTKQHQQTFQGAYLSFSSTLLKSEKGYDHNRSSTILRVYDIIFGTLCGILLKIKQHE